MRDGGNPYVAGVQGHAFKALEALAFFYFKRLQGPPA